MGDHVYLSTRNIKTRRPSDKLSLKYIGPFRVLKLIGNLAYWLDLPKEYKDIHPVFHVTLLRECNKRPTSGQLEVSTDTDNPGETSRPITEAILDSRQDAQGCLQYLVKWTSTDGVPESWEPVERIQAHLELVRGFHHDHPDRPMANTLKQPRGRPRGKGYGPSRDTSALQGTPKGSGPTTRRPCGRPRGRPQSRGD